MLFNSTTYLIFLTIVVWLFYQLTPRYRRLLLLLASYVFYWFWSVPWSLLLVASTAVNYSAARMLERLSERTLSKRCVLIGAIAFNLGVLSLFKYAEFFAEACVSVTGARPWPVLDLVLPMGISFYTFQLMSYTVDVYRGEVAAQRSLLKVALFVSFFPQLVAGPIERAGHLMQQLSADSVLCWANIRWGVSRIIAGLIKKVFIADSMALVVSEAYGDPAAVSGWRLLCATYAFAIQIYCDFSGYSDIAIGSARLLGIRLMENFNAPYLSLSIRDFWRRWHISLSAWLRDYLFIPLGGSRRGTLRTYANLMMTMLLGGLWHGAGWNWVIWGGLQGAMLSMEKAIGVENPAQTKSAVGRLVRWMVTFHLVCLSWVFFRAATFDDAWLILTRIATFADGRVPTAVGFVLLLGVLLLLAEKLELKDRWSQWCDKHTRGLVVASCVVAGVLVFIFQGVSKSEFIYFQF